MKKNKQKLPKQIYLQRKPCDCVAQKHQLINNCINCGKVVCSLQGQGPCFFCGNVVSRPSSNFVIANDQSLFPSLPKQQLSKVSQQRSKAILHKNILVERDKSNETSSNIYDQSLDYYELTQNQWIDEQDRQKAVDKILQKDKMLEQQQFKTRVKFDPITGSFVRQQLQFDNEAFKSQGKKFAEQKQKEQYKKKNEGTIKNWDERLLGNQRMKNLCDDLQIGKNKQKNETKQRKFQSKNIGEFIIQNQQQETHINQEKKEAIENK